MYSRMIGWMYQKLWRMSDSPKWTSGRGLHPPPPPPELGVEEGSFTSSLDPYRLGVLMCCTTTSKLWNSFFYDPIGGRTREQWSSVNLLCIYDQILTWTSSRSGIDSVRSPVGLSRGGGLHHDPSWFWSSFFFIALYSLVSLDYL